MLILKDLEILPGSVSATLKDLEILPGSVSATLNVSPAKMNLVSIARLSKSFPFWIHVSFFRTLVFRDTN